MQVQIEDVSPVEKKILVEVPWSTVDQKLSAAYRELSRNVRLKGFRAGKVPRSVLQRMYGKHVRAEVTGQLVRESFLSANQEHELQAVSEPRLDGELNMVKGKPVAFAIIVEVKGEVEAKDYDGMQLAHPPLTVSDEDVDEVIERLRKENAELQPIEGRDTTARTDVLTVKLTGNLDGNELDRPRLNIDLTDPAMEPLPGLLDALTGLPIDVADHAINLTVPEDHQDSELAGKTAELSITILDARRKEIPELDDDFASDIDRGETVAELRQSVSDELLERREKERRDRLRKDAIKELVQRNQIPVAPALIDRGVQLQFQRLQMMLGIGAEQLPGPSEELAESMRPAAIEEVRGELLLESVSKKEEVEATDEEIDEYIQEMAAARNVPVLRLRAELDRDGELESIQYQVRRDKTLDLLVERAEISEEEPAPPDSDDAGEGEDAAAAGDESPSPDSADASADADSPSETAADSETSESESKQSE